MEILIKGNVPSLKNSKVMGKYPSKTVLKWLRLYGIISYSASRKSVKFFKKIPKTYDFKDTVLPLKSYSNYPILLGFHFIRGSKHSWDFNNATHIILDLMTAFDIIPDDSTEYVLPFPLQINNKWWSFDKENPGVIIKVLN